MALPLFAGRPVRLPLRRTAAPIPKFDRPGVSIPGLQDPPAVGGMRGMPPRHPPLDGRHGDAGPLRAQRREPVIGGPEVLAVDLVRVPAVRREKSDQIHGDPWIPPAREADPDEPIAG